MELVAALRQLLADTFMFYVNTHIAHWNVTGPDFHEKHEFLGNLYEDLHGMVDDVAERIRSMDAMAPTSLVELVRGSEIGNQPPMTLWSDIQPVLVESNAMLIDCLKEACNEAQEANDQGLCNYLADRLDRHAKWGWQIRASR